MVVVRGVDVRVVVGIVKAEGNLFVDVNIRSGQSGKLFACRRLSDYRRYVVIGQAERFGGEVLHRERRVVGVKARIQHRDDRTRAVITRIGAVEDTRIKHIDGVFHKLRLGRLVFFTDNGGHTVAQRLTDRLIITRFDHQFKAAEYRRVILAGFIGDRLVIQCFEHLCLIGGDRLAQGRRHVALRSVLRKAHRRVGAIIDGHQIRLARFDDDGDLVVRLHRIRELERYLGIEILCIVGCKILRFLNEGCTEIVCRGCLRDRCRDGRKRTHQQSGSHRSRQKALAGFDHRCFFHGSISFTGASGYTYTYSVYFIVF